MLRDNTTDEFLLDTYTSFKSFDNDGLELMKPSKDELAEKQEELTYIDMNENWLMLAAIDAVEEALDNEK